jgi:hypothetical protein
MDSLLKRFILIMNVYDQCTDKTYFLLRLIFFIKSVKKLNCEEIKLKIGG